MPAGRGSPHETLLVLDAGTGQGNCHQAIQFDQAVGVTIVGGHRRTGRLGACYLPSRINLIARSVYRCGRAINDLSDFVAGILSVRFWMRIWMHEELGARV